MKLLPFKVIICSIIAILCCSNIQRGYGLLRRGMDVQSYLYDDNPADITISAAGDCTIGYDEEHGFLNSYNYVIDKMGAVHPFKNVMNIFKADDITVVNLETTFTDAKYKADKEFRFKGKPEYAKILNNASIECVNISNNHTHDYLEQGYKDTIDNLDKAEISYFGDGYVFTKNVKGVKIGFLGFKGWNGEEGLKKSVKAGLDELKKSCSISVVSFHWGIERENYPSSMQTNLGRYAIDCGADLVIGHHPHVIQGIEEYKGRHIVYSLGNFSYGGHKNPADKDTFIFIEKFKVCGSTVNLSQTQVIPCSISSVSDKNNYQPTLLYGNEGERVINRLKTYSSKLKYGYNFHDIIGLPETNTVKGYLRKHNLNTLKQITE